MSKDKLICISPSDVFAFSRPLLNTGKYLNHVEKNFSKADFADSKCLSCDSEAKTEYEVQVQQRDSEASIRMEKKLRFMSRF